ncbi:MAG: short-chain fatty acid transporter [Candidatus Binatota bacterium]|jgi:short-chain fatty acids transporter|nr:short-chain fatty acid transporter [Candidatus Binatota bacterium]
MTFDVAAPPAGESWLDRFARVMGRIVPDAISASVLLLIPLVAYALALGNSPVKTLDAYYQGLWMLLPFTMQMTLIVVLSSVLGATPLFKKGISSLARLPRTRTEVVALAVLATATAAYFYWGLGIAVTPLIAIHFASEAQRKHIDVDFLFLLALLWAANACWQYGLSSTAALLMATPGHFLEKTTGVLPLSTTIWSPAAILQEVGFVAILIALGVTLMPKRCRPVSEFPDARKLIDELPADGSPLQSFSEQLEHTPLVPAVLCLALAGWLYQHFAIRGLGLDINSMNTVLLLLCLVLHRTVHRFSAALQQGVVSAWPVIVIYHLYGGVAGLIQHTTVGEALAAMVASVSTPYTFPTLAAVSGAVVAAFVPSSGGQWVIQGFVTSQAAVDVGVSVQRGLLALGVGDHMGNLTSPFWYAIVAGIARVNFRDFYGYGLIFAAFWFALGVIVFTIAPC